MQELVTKILDQIQGKIHKSDSEIVLEGQRKRKDSFLKTPIIHVWEMERYLDAGTYEEVENLSIKDHRTLSHEIMSNCPTLYDRKKEAAEGSLSNSQSLLKNNFILCRDVGTDDLLLFSKENRALCDWMIPEAYLNLLPSFLSRELESDAPASLLHFDAYDIKPFKRENREGIPIIRLNAYKPPEWQKKHPEAKSEWLSEPPELFTRFLDNLIPIEAERKYVVDWIANALVKRNQSFLSLRGARGNGKTLFMKMIMAVIGNHYFAKDGINKDGFNADMKHKRIIGIDDDTFIGTHGGYRLRKQLTNTSVTYNAKFVQTNKSEKQYASYIIASNDEDPFYVTHEERKVVSVELSEVNAIDYLSIKERDWIDVLPKEDASEFTDKDITFLAQLGHFLLNYAKEEAEGLYGANTQYGGGVFWEDVVKSLPFMTRIAVEKVLTKRNTVISYDELLDEFDEHKSMGGRESRKRFDNIAKELSRFRYGESGDKLIEKVNELEQTFVVAKKYTPKPFEEDIDI